MRNIDEDITTRAVLTKLAGKTSDATDIESKFCTLNDNFALNPEMFAK